MIKNNLPESQTINQIGSGTTIKGEIKSNGDFRIDGSLNGSIESKGKIVVGESGKVEGEINCQNAVISGTIKANIRVSDLLELKSSSKFEGQIITKKLAIEPGATFSGSCNMEDVASNYNASNKHGSTKEKAS